MSNKVHGFIRKLFQNSKVNRENFVNNENSVKYKIITRKHHTFIKKRPFSFETGMGGGGDHKPSLLLFIFITTSIGIYNNQKSK